MHYYKRHYPYDAVSGKTDKASVSADGHTYTNPAYLVNIVTGAPGNREDESSCKTNDPLAVTCDEDYGYGYFSAVNGEWDEGCAL